MKQFLLPVCIFIICAVSGIAQDFQPQFIGVEALIIGYEGEVTQKENIRKNLSTLYSNYDPNGYYLNTLSFYTSFGAHAEYVTVSNKFGFILGLRYTYMRNSISYDESWTNQTYFYYLYSQDSLRTDYLKVHQITQQNRYIGIPLEIKYYWFRRPYKASPYIIAGAEMRYRMKSQTSLIMHDSNMKQFEDKILQDVQEPTNMHVSPYIGIGIKIGKEPKPTLLVESNVPFASIPSKSYGMVQPDAGAGVRVSAQFPLNSDN